MKLETVLVSCEQNAEAATPAISAIKQKVQHWIVWGIGLFCLTEAVRLMFFSDSIGLLVGLALLTPVPGCIYFGLRDYRQQAKAPVRHSLRTTSAREVAGAHMA